MPGVKPSASVDINLGDLLFADQKRDDFAKRVEIERAAALKNIERQIAAQEAAERAVYAANRQLDMELDAKKAGSRDRYLARAQAYEDTVDLLAGNAMLGTAREMSSLKDRAQGAIFAFMDDLKIDNKKMRQTAERVAHSVAASKYTVSKFVDDTIVRGRAKAEAGARWESDRKARITADRVDVASQADAEPTADLTDYVFLTPSQGANQGVFPAGGSGLFGGGEAPSMSGANAASPFDVTTKPIDLLPQYSKSASFSAFINYWTDGDEGTGTRDPAKLNSLFDALPGELVQEARPVALKTAEALSGAALIIRRGPGLSDADILEVAKAVFTDEKEFTEELAGLRAAAKAADGMDPAQRAQTADRLQRSADTMREFGSTLNRPVAQDVRDRLQRYTSALGMGAAYQEGEAATLRVLGMGAGVAYAKSAAGQIARGHDPGPIIDLVNSYSNKLGLPATFAKSLAQTLTLEAAHISQLGPDPMQGPPSSQAVAAQAVGMDPEQFKRLGAQALGDIDLGGVGDGDEVIGQLRSEIGDYQAILRSGNRAVLAKAAQSQYDPATGSVFWVKPVRGPDGNVTDVERDTPMFDPANPTPGPNAMLASILRGVATGDTSEADVRGMFGDNARRWGLTMEVLDRTGDIPASQPAGQPITPTPAEPGIMSEVKSMMGPEQSLRMRPDWDIPKNPVDTTDTAGYGPGDSIGPGSTVYWRERWDQQFKAMQDTELQSRAQMQQPNPAPDPMQQQPQTAARRPAVGPASSGPQRSQVPSQPQVAVAAPQNPRAGQPQRA